MPTLPVPKRTGVELPISGGRRATADDFAAPDVGGLARTVGKTVDAYLGHVEESEARKALVASSEIRAKYARELDAAALDGRDLGKLKEAMQNDLAKVGEGFETKRGMNSMALYAANTDLMFDEQANKISVQRAYATARLEGQKFLTSAGAVIQSNPAYLATAEKDAEAFGSTLVGIRPEQRAEIVHGLKTELNMGAAVAQARIDPEGTKKKLEAGAWTLTPDQRNIAINRADTEMRAKRAEESYAREAEERERRDRNDKARDKHFAGIMGGTATRRSIMDDADLLPATREHMIMLMEQRAKTVNGQEKASDPAAVRELWLDIHAADTDPRKILNADKVFEYVKAGRINVTDANRLVADVSNQKDENNRSLGGKLRTLSMNFERAVAGDQRLAGFDASQKAEIMNSYTGRVMERVAEYRKENNVQGLRDMFDPRSKEYVGSADFMAVSISEARQRVLDKQPKVIKIAGENDPMLVEVGIGQQFVDPQGVTRVMTKELKDRLGTPGAKGPVVSGKIQGAQ